MAVSPGGTSTWTVVTTVTMPPCLSHSGLASLARDTVVLAALATRRNKNARKIRKPARNTLAKRAGSESKNHAQSSMARTASRNPCVQRVASTVHGTSTRSSISLITCEGVISLISASLVRMIRC